MTTENTVREIEHHCPICSASKLQIVANPHPSGRGEVRYVQCPTCKAKGMNVQTMRKPGRR